MSGEATHSDFMVRDSRQPGHFWADNEILDIYGPKLGAHGIAVYMAMARRADNSTGQCMLSTQRIAEQVWMSKGGVFNALAVIVSLGLARKVLDGEGPRPAVYVLADVKAISVHLVNGKRSSHERTVHPVNAQYGKKTFIKTKPTPPTPPLQGGDVLNTSIPNQRRRLQRDLAKGPCEAHPDSRVSPSGGCWDCYAGRYTSGCQSV